MISLRAPAGSAGLHRTSPYNREVEPEGRSRATTRYRPLICQKRHQHSRLQRPQLCTFLAPAERMATVCHARSSSRRETTFSNRCLCHTTKCLTARLFLCWQLTLRIYVWAILGCNLEQCTFSLGNCIMFRILDIIGCTGETDYYY